MVDKIRHESMRIAGKKVDTEKVINVEYPYTGEIIGSVSGGCIEGSVIAEGIKCLSDGKTRIRDYGITNDMAWEVGLACGGELKILIQPLNIQDEIIYSIVKFIENRDIAKLEIDCSNGKRVINNSIINNTSHYDPSINKFIHIFSSILILFFKKLSEYDLVKKNNY